MYTDYLGPEGVQYTEIGTLKNYGHNSNDLHFYNKVLGV